MLRVSMIFYVDTILLTKLKDQEIHHMVFIDLSIFVVIVLLGSCAWGGLSLCTR